MPDRIVVVERIDEFNLKIVHTCDKVGAGEKWIKSNPGTYSILTFNQIDTTVRPPERVTAGVLQRGTTFGRARGKMTEEQKAARRAKREKNAKQAAKAK